MSTIPIPQGSTIADAPAEASAAANPNAVPIPNDAIIESHPGKGVTTDSMDADYQFKNPALSDAEMQQLKDANLSRPLYRKILGLPSDDPNAAALENKDQAHQTESAQHSSYVQEQFKDKAVGAAVVASAPLAMPSTVAAAGGAARTIATVGPPLARLISSPAGTWAAKELVKGALIGTGITGAGGIITKLMHLW